MRLAPLNSSIDAGFISWWAWGK